MGGTWEDSRGRCSERWTRGWCCTRLSSSAAGLQVSHMTVQLKNKAVLLKGFFTLSVNAALETENIWPRHIKQTHNAHINSANSNINQQTLLEILVPKNHMFSGHKFTMVRRTVSGSHVKLSRTIIIIAI